MEIKNTTRKPIKVPLPAGKGLFLGPNAKGQVSDKAVEHPPFKELLDDGTIEIIGSGRSKASGPSNTTSNISNSSNSKGGGAAMRKSGDR
mgnify:CR=1 FL=1|jgi:hypothetical protein